MHWKAVQSILYGCTRQHERGATEGMMYFNLLSTLTVLVAVSQVNRG